MGNADNPYVALIKAKRQNFSSCEIHDGTKFIADSAFRSFGKMTSVTIPDSVTSIGRGAFGSCSGLTDITFNGTKEQWKAISKDSDWNAKTDEYTIHCTEGDIAKSDESQQ